MSHKRNIDSLALIVIYWPAWLSVAERRSCRQSRSLWVVLMNALPSQPSAAAARQDQEPLSVNKGIGETTGDSMIDRKSSLIVGIAAMCMLALSGRAAQRREGQQVPDKGGKARVVIIGTGSSDLRWTTNVTTATLEDAIQQSGRFELITGAQRDKLLTEQGFNNSDVVDPKQATQVGKLLSARYIIIGNALDVTASTRKVPHSGLLNRVGVSGGGEEVSSDVRAKVQIQMIDSQTGVVKLSRSYEEKVSKDTMTRSQGDSEKLREGYRKAMEKISVQFAREFGLSVPIDGLVVFVKGERIAIDIGGDKAAQVGQDFEIYTEDEPIKNAAGEVLSYNVTKYARIRVDKVEPKLSWVSVVETYDENGKRDPQPRLDRIKLNYSVKQVASPGPR